MIFIVDDSPTDIELTTIALEATGREIRVRSALDGKSALAMLRNGLGVPALILLDLKMPGMSGIEVLREIRADDRLKEIPVVVVTSSALESDRTEAIAAWCKRLYAEAFGFGSIRQRYGDYSAALAAELVLNALLQISTNDFRLEYSNQSSVLILVLLREYALQTYRKVDRAICLFLHVPVACSSLCLKKYKINI